MTLPTWTKEKTAQLCELWPTDMGCKQIAQRLGGGTTKNSVISKARRLKLDARTIITNGIVVYRNCRPADPALASSTLTPEQRVERKRARDKISARRRKAKRGESATMSPHEYRTEAPPVPLEPAQVYTDSLNLPLLELDPKGCRFATTGHDVLEHRFCGQRKLFGLPYCGFHTRVAYTPNPYRTKARAW